MYFSIAYFKGDQSDVTEQEVSNAVAELREMLTQGELSTEVQADAQPCYNLRMTFMTVTYELQNPLGLENYRALGKFANTYGLKRFRVDDKRNWLHFDYDASRLKDSVVQHVLREAKIPVVREVPREEVQ